MYSHLFYLGVGHAVSYLFLFRVSFCLYGMSYSLDVNAPTLLKIGKALGVPLLPFQPLSTFIAMNSTIRQKRYPKGRVAEKSIHTLASTTHLFGGRA